METPELWLTIVPGEFERLIKKARSDAGYARWLAFADDLLRDNKPDHFDEQAGAAVKKDVMKLKTQYRYSPRDFFYDEHRCTGTLDYLLNDEIEYRGLDLGRDIILEGGMEIDGHCKSTQGIPLKVYTPQQVSALVDFIGHLDFKNLSKHYDDEKPVAFGVYKPAAGSEHVEEAFTRIKALFKRAYHHTGTYILKKID